MLNESGDVVVYVMLGLMLVALLGGLLHRWHTNSSITHRFIQFEGVSLLIGSTVILALEGILDGTAVGAILGAVVGYLFGMRKGA